MSPVIINASKLNFLSKLKMTGQHVRQSKDLPGQYSILTGHCPLTGHYFKPCYYESGAMLQSLKFQTLNPKV